MRTAQTTPTEVANIHARRAAIFARLTLLGCVLYLVVDIIAQLLPPHYSPISQAESDLGVGPYGWVMSINFLLRGLLSLSAVAALKSGLLTQARSRAGEMLLALWGIGAIILAFAPTDLPGHHPTLHGLVHLVVAFLAFILGAVGELLLSLRLRVDHRMHSVATVATMLSVLAIVALLVQSVTLTSRIGGLVERVFIGLILLWMCVVAARIQSLAAAACPD